MKQICTITASAPAKSILTAHGTDAEGETVMAVTHLGRGLVYANVDPWVYNEYTDGRKNPLDEQNFAAGEQLTRWIVQQAVERSGGRIGRQHGASGFAHDTEYVLSDIAVQAKEWFTLLWYVARCTVCCGLLRTEETLRLSESSFVVACSSTTADRVKNRLPKDDLNLGEAQRYCSSPHLTEQFAKDLARTQRGAGRHRAA